MSSDKELREGKAMALEVQFTEVDCITVAEVKLLCFVITLQPRVE